MCSQIALELQSGRLLIDLRFGKEMDQGAHVAGRGVRKRIVLQQRDDARAALEAIDDELK